MIVIWCAADDLQVIGTFTEMKGQINMYKVAVDLAKYHQFGYLLWSPYKVTLSTFCIGNSNAQMVSL